MCFAGEKIHRIQQAKSAEPLSLWNEVILYILTESYFRWSSCAKGRAELQFSNQIEET